MLTRVRVVSPKKPLGRSGSLTNRKMISAVFFHIFLLQKCNVCFKKTKNKRKRGRGWPFLKKTRKMIRLAVLRDILMN